MAEPDIYRSKDIVYGGRAKPAVAVPNWVPAMGNVVDVSLNTFDSAKGSLLKVGGITGTWTGFAYAPWKGDFGWMMSGAGGHDALSDGAWNWLMYYDIGTRLCGILKPAAQWYLASDGYVADTVTGWLWTDSTATNVQVGEPFTSHFYGYQICLPPDAIGDNADGYLFTPGRTSMGTGGQRDTNQGHRFALDGTATKWQMFGNPLPRSPGHSATIYDAARKRVISINESNSSITNTHPYIDLKTGATGFIKTSAATSGYYSVQAKYEKYDCYMLIRQYGTNLRFRVMTAFDNAAAVMPLVTPTIIGTPPPEVISTDSSGNITYYEPAYCWVEAWDCWVLVPRTGNEIYYLKCIGDPRTGTWVWSKFALNGTLTLPKMSAGSNPYNRLRYVEKLNTFIWIPRHDMPVQAFTIPAP